MMKLTEIILNEEEFDLSALADLDDVIAKELNKAADQQNEAFFSTAAFLLAVPGILKAIDKIGRTITKKAGINLSKREPTQVEKAYNLILKAAEKIDSYIDVPFNKILTPFIKDNNKRRKVANFIKALTLAIMSISGGVNMNTATELKNILANLAPDAAKELAQAIAEKSGPKITSIAKNFFNSL